MSGSIRLSKDHGVNPSMDTCYYCGEAKGILLFGRLPGDKEAPRHTVTNYEPCEKCKETMAQGITVFEMIDDKTPSGRMIVVKEEIFKTLFSDIDKILESRRCMMTKEMYEKVFAEVLEKN
jgi:hypothetical protein